MQLLIVLLLSISILWADSDPARAVTRAVRYGANPAAGHTFTHDGVELYYEVYGAGEPLLLVHGNGGSIADFRAQIPYFRKHYRVIAMDSREQGRSGDSPDPLTYEKMTDDLAALIDHLKLRSVDVVGWSDGGIEALLLGIRHPTKVKKLVAMSANLTPDGLRPDAIALIKTLIDATPAADRDTPKGRRELKVTSIMFTEPNIDVKALEAITAPTLILAGDHDLIRDEHTIAIYQHLPNSQLAIFPNATHLVPFDNQATFNATVDRFLRTPFMKRDRIDDTLESLEKLRAKQP